MHLPVVSTTTRWAVPSPADRRPLGAHRKAELTVNLPHDSHLLLHHHGDGSQPDHDRGLAFDVGTLVSRRRLLTLFAGTGAAVALAACASDSDSATSATASDSTTASTDSTSEVPADPATTATTSTACETIPEETAGPFPADGSNGLDVLTESGIVRSDIRSSFGGSTTTADGVPLTITLQVSDTAAGCVPMPGAAVYVWHCDREGRYSMYSEGATDQNYLRGVQETDANGNVTFTSVFPAAYSGRWPHIHFEVYASITDATRGGALLATSQVALPEDACHAVFAQAGYEQSVQNMTQTSLADDNVFSDGWDQQLGIVTGDVATGLTVTLAVPV
jgi:protocatechuate 3,4-dioxygenase beta subunit